MDQANILRKFIQGVHAMRTGDQRGEDNFGSDFMRPCLSARRLQALGPVVLLGGAEELSVGGSEKLEQAVFRRLFSISARAAARTEAPERPPREESVVGVTVRRLEMRSPAAAALAGVTLRFGGRGRPTVPSVSHSHGRLFPRRARPALLTAETRYRDDGVSEPWPGTRVVLTPFTPG
ncbi:hypothetical protein COCON_G00115630 [Conger conger]|uniref:Uncharacterized protein n=1 Tax=Conger conger TaxID=82655 RepID=A0A9Q1DG51_CONCO|nr:hypothetical protein COCON_G00115630 [Conger conger]